MQEASRRFCPSSTTGFKVVPGYMGTGSSEVQDCFPRSSDVSVFIAGLMHIHLSLCVHMCAGMYVRACMCARVCACMCVCACKLCPWLQKLTSASFPAHRKVEDLQFRVEEESITKGDLEVTDAVLLCSLDTVGPVLAMRSDLGI